MNEILIPYANPVKFTKMTPAAIPQYVSKFMDTYLFEQTIKPWEQRTTFFQPWLMNDSIRLQVKSNYGPTRLKLYRCDGSLVLDTTFNDRQQDQYRPGYFIRQIELDTASFQPGKYYLTITAGNSMPWVSEPQVFLTSMPNSSYVEYSHYEKYGELYFQSPYSPAIRLPGGIYYENPGSKDTVYEDQPLNTEMIQSIPFDVYRFVLGESRGVPPWLIKKVNRIFGVSDLKIDGRYYTKPDDAEWSKQEQPNYPMKGWQILLRNRYNREGDLFQDDVAKVGLNSMVAVLNTKGFGIDDSGGDFLEISDIN